MNLINTVTMSLEDYEALQIALRNKEDLIDKFQRALIDAIDGKEVVISITEPNYWQGTGREFRVINPPDHIKEMKHVIDVLREQKEKMQDELNNKKHFGLWATFKGLFI
jgi:hypothetical protein